MSSVHSSQGWKAGLGSSSHDEKNKTDYTTNGKQTWRNEPLLSLGTSVSLTKHEKLPLPSPLNNILMLCIQLGGVFIPLSAHQKTAERAYLLPSAPPSTTRQSCMLPSLNVDAKKGVVGCNGAAHSSRNSPEETHQAAKDALNKLNSQAAKGPTGGARKMRQS